MNDLHSSTFERAVGQAAGRMDAGWSAERTESALAGLHRRRVRRAVTRSGAAALLLVAAAAWGSQTFGAAPDDPAVAVTTPAANETAADRATPAPGILSSDATRLETDRATARGRALADGTRMLAADGTAEAAEVHVSADAVRVELAPGRTRFDRTAVAGSRQLELRAGTVRVHVFASRFSAARYESKLELWVDDGYLEVADGEGRHRVAAGQHRSFALGDGHDVETAGGVAGDDVPLVAALDDDRRDDDRPDSDDSRDSEDSDDLGDSDDSRDSDDETAAAARRTRRTETSRKRGPAREPSARDLVGRLLEQADRERKAGRPEAAADLLRQIVRQHRDDARAPLAGFTLGRVLIDDLGRASAAARAFDRARRLDPSGPLAEDALARAAEAWHRAGDRDRAGKRADAYLDRYPDGHRARAVRQYSTR